MKQSKKSKRLKRSSGLKKILKNLRRQKKQSSQIEKIFSSSKEKRQASSIVEDPLMIKSVPETSNEDTRKTQSQKSKGDLKIVKFNVKDGKTAGSSRIQDKLRKNAEDDSSHGNKNAPGVKSKNISKASLKTQLKQKLRLKKDRSDCRS